MQTGSSGTLIGWKSGQTTFVPLWDWMEGAWLRTLMGGHHMVTTCVAKSAWKPWETHQTTNFKELLGGGLRAGCVLASIAFELDREHLRNLRGETETEFVRNSKVLVDFKVQASI